MLLIAALQLIRSMFEGEPCRKQLFAQFLSPSHCIESIWTEAHQGSEVIIRDFAPHIPLP